MDRRAFLGSCLCLSLTGLTPPILPHAARRFGGPGAPAPPTRTFEAAYLALHRSGELARRGERLWRILEHCELCPRRCGANRLGGAPGFCGATSTLVISGYHPHFGEERSLVGRWGSGTIFLSHCNLRCVFCLNWETSQGGQGTERSLRDMADMMLSLQARGCHNINVVTPTHYSPHVLRALDIAAGRGLAVPVVWNTSGWERLEILDVLDGVVDIYLPDFKYADGRMAARYSSSAESYPEVTKAALLEMNRQVGVARPTGIQERGLMIRHLVMPNDVSGSVRVMEWIAANLPRDTYVNIMSQYHPMYRASEYPELARPITFEEYDAVVKAARGAGLTSLDIQGYPSG